jgi:hypothetical protein
MKIAIALTSGFILLSSCENQTKGEDSAAFSGKYEYITPDRTLSEISEFRNDSASNTITDLIGSCITLQSIRGFSYKRDSLCFSKGTAMHRDNCDQEFKAQPFPTVCRFVRNVNDAGYDLFRPAIIDVDTGVWYQFKKIE